MLRNYLISTLRNLNKTSLFAATNIIGLSVGMAIFLLILNFVSFERSYDKFHNHHERIYRIRYERYSEDGESVRFASCCPPVGLRIRTLLPEVEKVARIFRLPASVSFNENRFIEERLFFAEPEFFEIFNFKFINANPVTGLSAPNKAFISQSTAQKYFGSDDPIGKTISVDKRSEFQIVGIFEDVPKNSHIKFDIVMPWSSLLEMLGADYDEAWGHSGAFTYILFKQRVDIPDFQKKLDEIANKEFGEALRHYNLTMKLPLQPLTDIHLTSHYQQEFEVNGDKTTINLLLIVAVFIIALAWVNYINLSTSRSLTRAKEVGLRKVLGASRHQLVIQFFIEVVIINLLALVLSLFLVEVFQSLFMQVTGTPINSYLWSNQCFWFVLVVMFILGVILSGLYPVILLSSFNPLKVIQGRLGSKPKGVNLRKALVVFQFTMSLVLLTSTFAVLNQVTFMKRQDLGFSINQVLVVRGPRVKNSNFKSNLSAFKQEIIKNSSIPKMCVVTEVPGRQIYWDAGGIHPVGSSDSKNYQIVGVDYDFATLFGVTFIEGRNFSKEFPSDSVALILNETAVKWMGFTNIKSCIGQQVDYWGEIFTIVGVIKDYHQQSPKAAFEPHIYRLMPYGRGDRSMFAFKINTSDNQDVLMKIKNKYDILFPGNPFEYFFLNDYFEQQYKSDIVLGKVFGLFAVLAVFITSLGILGLFSYNISQRAKEISIRSVLGANTAKILYLFAKQFFKLMIFSFICALPLCYFGINLWLNSFAKKMAILPWLFIVPLLILLTVANITISLLIIKNTRVNPVENLKYE
jgi:putative ABC transport system permease protein